MGEMGESVWRGGADINLECECPICLVCHRRLLETSTVFLYLSHRPNRARMPKVSGFFSESDDGSIIYGAGVRIQSKFDFICHSPKHCY